MTANIVAKPWQWPSGGQGTGGTYNSNQLTLVGPYAIGVPHPENDFGYDPLTLAIPSDPAEWPSAENSSFYYIDNADGAATDTANTFGYPDKPRLTIPVGTFAAGIVMVLGGGSGYIPGGPGKYEFTFNGTQSNPCWFVGRNVHTLDQEIRIIASTHCFIDGIIGGNVSGPTVNYGIGDNTFCTMRNCVLTGDGLDNGFGQVVNSGGDASGNKNTDYLVIYNNTISDFGDLDGVENDFHGIKPGARGSFHWYLDNTINAMGGDSVQIGDAVVASEDWCTFIFIAKCNFFGNFEDCIDIKQCSDIIISENELHDGNVNDSAGAAVVIHEEGDWVTVIANDIYLITTGVINTGCDNMSTIGNKFTDITPIGAYDPDTAFGDGQCIHYRGLNSNAYIASNTMNDYAKGIQIAVGASPTIDFIIGSNLFSNRNRTDGFEMMWASSSNTGGTDTDFNCYYNPTFTTQFKWGSNTGDLSTFQSSLSPFDANSVTGDPEYTNAATRDFSIGATSSALNNGEESAFYDAFEARYGIDVKKDILDITRPQGADWDNGAYERVV